MLVLPMSWVADEENKIRYDFTGRLSFDWPNKEANTSDANQAVDDLLLSLGQGLSYGAEPILLGLLSETISSEAKAVANIIFSGSNRKPWNAYVGDASDWHKTGVGSDHGNTLWWPYSSHCRWHSAGRLAHVGLERWL